MPTSSTYSFQHVDVVISHPSFGQRIINGQGTDTITVAMATERTVHDVAADGSIMPSKVLGRNGTVTINLQQTSEAHKWLRSWYNWLESADPSQWAGTAITIRSSVLGIDVVASGVSPQKLPDLPLQGQGQKISWNFMATDIQQN